MATPRFPSKRIERCWRHPWRRRARFSRSFRRFCLRHGYLSPHFRVSEFECHDGTPVPSNLIANAQRHAFNLERFRRELHGHPLPILSAYRTPAYNRKIGGASQSRHMQADATDFTKQLVDSVGRSRFFAAADKVFSKGGVGDYPAGSAHVDSRGWRARWRSF